MLAIWLLSTLIYLAIGIFYLICYWRIYQKAGEPGWVALVPFYNTYVLFKLSMENGWLFLLCFVPVANWVIAILWSLRLAKAFGKEIGFGIGLLFLPIVFYPMLAFGEASYCGPPKW